MTRNCCWGSFCFGIIIYSVAPVGPRGATRSYSVFPISGELTASSLLGKICCTGVCGGLQAPPRASATQREGPPTRAAAARGDLRVLRASPGASATACHRSTPTRGVRTFPRRLGGSAVEGRRPRPPAGDLTVPTPPRETALSCDRAATVGRSTGRAAPADSLPQLGGTLGKKNGTLEHPRYKRGLVGERGSLHL